LNASRAKFWRLKLAAIDLPEFIHEFFVSFAKRTITLRQQTMSAEKILWVYIILLVTGGLIGFLKAKSRVSLIMSVAFAVVLIIAAIPGILDPRFARGFVNVVMALLLVVFTIRLMKTKKFMPAGFMLVITIVALALLNIFR
jgi:uncharacterized membrane protein (UPF0136 family)